MDNKTQDKKVYAYMLYGIGAFTILCSVFFSNIYLVAFTAVMIFSSVAYFNSGHMINNLILRKSAIIEMCNGFWLSHNLNSMIKKTDEGYVAVAIAVIMPEEKKLVDHGRVKEVIESIRLPFEFRVTIKEVDSKRLYDTIETKKRMKEILLSRTDPKKHDKVNSLKREIDILESEISSIRTGGRALDMFIRVFAFANSGSEIEASREAYSNIMQIGDSFSAALGVKYEIANGEELVNLIEGF
jgi:hypothetical protein